MAAVAAASGDHNESQRHHMASHHHGTQQQPPRHQPTLLPRLLYAILYAALGLLLLFLLFVTPADAIRQAVANGQRYNVAVIAGTYLLTVLVTLFVYATRLYVTRQVLAAVPRVGVLGLLSGLRRDAGVGSAAGVGVGADVKGMVQKELGRSAQIAWHAQPRVTRRPGAVAAAGGEGEQDGEMEDGRRAGIQSRSGTRRIVRKMLQHLHARSHSHGAKRASANSADAGQGVSMSAASAGAPAQSVNQAQDHAVWGAIEHAGWSSPNAPELPDLHYAAVVAELPHLIEAKALTLAPPAPYVADVGVMVSSDKPEQQQQQAVLDPESVALLARPPAAGMREYVMQLVRLGVFDSWDDVGDVHGKTENKASKPDGRDVYAGRKVAMEFVEAYERARFTEERSPVTAAEFSRLMSLFAEVLRCMKEIDPAILAHDDGSDDVSDAEQATDGGLGPPNEVVAAEEDEQVSHYDSFATDASSHRSGARSSSGSGSPAPSSTSSGSRVVHRTSRRMRRGRRPRDVRSRVSSSSAVRNGSISANTDTWSRHYCTAPTTPIPGQPLAADSQLPELQGSSPQRRRSRQAAAPPAALSPLGPRRVSSTSSSVKSGDSFAQTRRPFDAATLRSLSSAEYNNDENAAAFVQQQLAELRPQEGIVAEKAQQGDSRSLRSVAASSDSGASVVHRLSNGRRRAEDDNTRGGAMQRTAAPYVLTLTDTRDQ